MGILKIRKEELPMLVVPLVLFIALNALLVVHYFDTFTREHVGYWSLFYKNFNVSGFDPYNYIMASCARPMYDHVRHPLLWLFTYPMYGINQGLRAIFGFNTAVVLLGVIWTVLDAYTYLFVCRSLREGLDLNRREAMTGGMFTFGIAYVMLPSFAPDHMMMTMSALALTLLVAVRAMNRGRVIGRWKIFLLTFLATGITTTSIAKVYLADAIAMFRRCSVRSWIVKSLFYLLPLACIGIGYIALEETVYKQERKTVGKIIRKNSETQKGRERLSREKTFWEQKKKNAIGDAEILKFTDTSIDKTESLVHNVFGESFQLHDEHLFEDRFRGKPLFVHYGSVANYIVEAFLVLILFGGIIIGWRNRMLLITASWAFMDFILHVVLSFALDEVYLMTAHWALVMPVSLAVIIRASKSRAWLYRLAMGFAILMTAWLWGWNGYLVVRQLL